MLWGSEFIGYEAERSQFAEPEVSATVDTRLETSFKMSQVWERRYYRTGQGTGWEVAILRRSYRPREWIVLSPQGLKSVNISDRRAIRASPDFGRWVAIEFQPLAVLTEAQRRATLAEAETAFEARSLEVLGPFVPAGPTTWLRRWLAVAGSTPAMGAKWVRWCLRSRSRFAGFVTMTYLAYESLEMLGLFEKVKEWVGVIQSTRAAVTETLAAQYEWFAETQASVMSIYEVLQSKLNIQRAGCLLGALGVLWWAVSETLQESEEGDSRTSSRASSGSPSEGGTPPESPRTIVIDSGMKVLSEGFTSQQASLNTLISHQKELMERLQDLADDRASQKLLREARGREEPHLMAQLSKRLDAFESMLKKDAAPEEVATPGRGCSLGLSSPAKEEVESEETAGRAAAHPKSSSAVQSMIGKLKRAAETPQEIFVKCLEDFREEDPEEWAKAFPVGYRRRCAPQFLGEVYAQGKTAKAWAKEWIKARGLDDYGDARELIAVMGAVDSMIIVDRQPEAINSVTLERLAKKGYGIQQGCRKVTCVSDWKKPKDAGKTWKSKVDFTIWLRTDPSRLQDDELSFVNRELEDEIRTEMDRDAALLKARAKLEERGGEAATI